MSFARKRARFSRKAEEKALLREQQYNNQLYSNINSVTEILRMCEPKFKEDITQVLIRQMFAMSFMALHDEFGFGRERIMRYYKKMLSLQYELREHGGERPLDTLLIALKDEYKFDLDKAMVEANKEFDEAQRKGV
jgi:hypothetical protein